MSFVLSHSMSNGKSSSMDWESIIILQWGVLPAVEKEKSSPFLPLEKAVLTTEFSLTLPWVLDEKNAVGLLTSYSVFSLTQSRVYFLFLPLGRIRKTRTTRRTRVAWTSSKSVVCGELLGVITMILAWKLFYK